MADRIPESVVETRRKITADRMRAANAVDAERWRAAEPLLREMVGAGWPQGCVCNPDGHDKHEIGCSVAALLALLPDDPQNATEDPA